MKSWTKPTPDLVRRALAQLTHPGHNRYFFENLKNPKWLEPLRENGVFKFPPPVERDTSKQTIKFPIWPASGYLSRMASLKPQIVYEIISEVPETENVRVYEDLADAAIKLPPEFIIKLMDKVMIWARSKYQLLLPEKLGQLASNLARNGKPREALKLLNELLRLTPNTRTLTSSYIQYKPQAQIEDWDYEQILKKHLPEVAKADFKNTLAMLIGILKAGMKYSDDEGKLEDCDNRSYGWRPAIENHSQNSRSDILGHILSSVRDSCELALNNNLIDFRDLIGYLEKHKLIIFRRLVLYLLAKYSGLSKGFLKQYLISKDLFESLHERHEYANLLRECFVFLEEADKEVILSWIDQGPDVRHYIERERDHTGENPSDNEIDSYKKGWQLSRLSWFSDSLPEKWRQYYDSLVKKFGKPEHTDFPVYVSSGSWRVSEPFPKSADELNAMTTGDIVKLIQSIRKDPEPTEGFTDQLAKAVVRDSVRFSSEAIQFKDVRPAYLYALLTGIKDSVIKKSEIRWPPVMELSKEAVSQYKVDSVELDHGSIYSMIKRMVLELLEKGFEEGPHSIPFNLRTQIWDIVHILTRDSDPTPEHEERYGGTNMDPLTLSLNTIRGQAMHSVIRYALWVKRNLKTGYTNMDSVTEVRTILDEHLNPRLDPSLAIRAVYGQWFPWLALLDERWARENVLNIFPAEPQPGLYYNAAWNSYILFCEPYDQVFKILEGQYRKALKSLSIDEKHGSLPGDPREHYAAHIFTFFWRGLIELNNHSIISEFWKTAPKELKQYSIEFIGRSLVNTKGVAPKLVLERLMVLWQQRAAEAKKIKNYDELIPFGWWFASGKLDAGWALDQLHDVLSLSKKIDPEHMVVEELSKLTDKHLINVVICLKLIVFGNRDEWRIHGWKEHALKILSVGIHSAIDEIRISSENIIHELGRQGYLEFGNLLKKGDGD